MNAGNEAPPDTGSLAIDARVETSFEVGSVFHVTVLSNLARGYDRYRRVYSKARIPESTYPGESYVLPMNDLSIGLAKAERLRQKLGLPLNELVALEAAVPAERLRPHPRGGPGMVWPSSDLPVKRLHRVTEGRLYASAPEEMMARSLALNAGRFLPYEQLQPRSVSFLPIARGCQAACHFCFSEASASVDQPQAARDWAGIRSWIERAAVRGAQRAVITGGGEPTLMPWEDLLALVRACRERFATVVLITNGVSLARASDVGERLVALREAGMTVLAISRHHTEELANARIMNLETHTATVLGAARGARPQLSGMKLRLVCVLQRKGVETVADVAGYVDWAEAQGVDEVCFKWLYVSTSLESVYHSRQANEWSAQHQVSLDVVHDWAEGRGGALVSRLAWGAPIFEVPGRSRRVRVAAYTEPSLFWERTHGLARSWNVMADGRCLASLEDRASVLPLALPAVAS